MEKAYDRDFTAASSIDRLRVAMHNKFGFGPVNAQWEAYAQGREGATMVLKVADGTDFDTLADNLERPATEAEGRRRRLERRCRPRRGSGRDAVTPEVQFVALLEDQGLVVTSDNPPYAARASRVAAGDGEAVPEVGDRRPQRAPGRARQRDAVDRRLRLRGPLDVPRRRGRPGPRRPARVATPAASPRSPGFAMGMQPDRTLRVVEHFEDSDRAEENLRPRAKLAVGEAPGRGLTMSDYFDLTTSKAQGSDVVLDLAPKRTTGYVLSALDDGPLLLATC